MNATKETQSTFTDFVTLVVIVVFAAEEARRRVSNLVASIIISVGSAKESLPGLADSFSLSVIMNSVSKQPGAAFAYLAPFSS